MWAHNRKLVTNKKIISMIRKKSCFQSLSNHQNRHMSSSSSSSILNKVALNRILGTAHDDQVRQDLDRAMSLVRKYDPSGYLPGLLLATNDAKLGYFAARAFWIETGLRFDTNGSATTQSSSSRQVAGVGQKGVEISPTERVNTWRQGIQSLFDDMKDDENTQDNNSNNSNDDNDAIGPSLWTQNGTLRLLHHVIEKHNLSKHHFDQIISGRELDIDRKQYPTIQSLIDHANMSCGSLFHLILESSDIDQSGSESSSIIYKTAQDLGIAHGLANALRTSVPVASSTGKIIIPQELCEKYGVRSPRYLLSALGMGDEECKSHLQSAVKDITYIARDHLDKARSRRDDILHMLDDEGKGATTASSTISVGEKAVSAFLPGLASETFLNRLEQHNFDLTDRNLRNVGNIEHLTCAGRMLSASLQKTY